MCFACAEVVAGIQHRNEVTKMRREFSHSSTSSEGSTFTRATLNSQNTVETARTEVSEMRLKTPKTVRFDEISVKKDETASHKEVERQFDWGLATRKTVSKLKHTFKVLGRKIERPLITILMRIGY